MNPHKPHIIIEGSVQYSLGELKDNQMLYDFDKIHIHVYIYTSMHKRQLSISPHATK